MRLSTKIMISAFLAGICIIVLGVFSLWQLSVVNEKSNEVFESWLASIAYVGRMDKVITNYRIYEFSYLGAETDIARENAIKNMKNSIENYKGSFELYNTLIDSAKEQSLADTFSEEWNEYLNLSSQVLQLANEGRLSEANFLLRNRGNILFEQLSASLLAVVEYNKDGGAKAARESDMIYAQSRRFLAIIILFIFVIGLFLWFWTSHSLYDNLTTAPSAR